MLSHFRKYITTVIYSIITGAAAGAMIFIFKKTANIFISLSSYTYGAVRNAPILLPVLICGAGIVGLAASFILKAEPDARGGGIPASIAILRGFTEFRWFKTLLAVFSSVMLTFLCGVPLGTEGPTVQMGTSIGRGTVTIFGKKHAALDRYAMTGGACAGFAAATGAPLCGILFAFEEAHRRVTPMIFISAAASVMSSMSVLEALNLLTGGSTAMFSFTVGTRLPIPSLWTPVLIGLVCGVIGVLFTKGHRAFGGLINKKLSKIPFSVKLAAIFAVSAVCGFFSDDLIGTGHSLIDKLIEGDGLFSMLIVILLVRGILFLTANNAGVTGGSFIPTLALGALIGAVCANALIGAGVMDGEYYALAVTLGMAAYLSAVSKTPLMSIAFGIEALSGGGNILSFVIASLAAYFVMEATGTKEFADTVIENKVHASHAGKTLQVIETEMTVVQNSFADGMELSDLLLPPGCEVSSAHTALKAGDTVLVHCRTHTPEYTNAKLREIFGNS